MALPGQSSPEQILAVAGDCYLIQSISGIHSGVNPISGDFSVGAEGIRVRGGELAEPVKEFTISSNLQKMLLDVRAVGNDLTFRPGGTAGLTLAIDNVNVSGT
jgi:PmbA protein